MGKSTAMKHLAISWADGTAEELKKFDFVFHISLKLVRDNRSNRKHYHCTTRWFEGKWS